MTEFKISSAWAESEQASTSSRGPQVCSWSRREQRRPLNSWLTSGTTTDGHLYHKTLVQVKGPLSSYLPAQKRLEPTKRSVYRRP